MKKTILFLGVWCLMSVYVIAQGTLQFNQVKIVTTQETVPAGKVWKVQNALPSVATSNEPFSIKIDNQETFVSSYERGDHYLSNVLSIDIQIRKTSTSSCNQVNNYYLAVTGFENDFPFYKEKTGGISKDAASTSFTTLFTFTPQIPGSIMEITQLKLWTPNSSGTRWTPYEIKMIVNYKDGSSHSYVYTEPYNDLCQSSGWERYFIGSSTSPMVLPIRSKDTYFVPVEFPIWLGAGKSLEKGNGIMGLTVIEFNVIP